SLVVEQQNEQQPEQHLDTEVDEQQVDTQPAHRPILNTQPAQPPQRLAYENLWGMKGQDFEVTNQPQNAQTLEHLLVEPVLEDALDRPNMSHIDQQVEVNNGQQNSQPQQVEEDNQLQNAPPQQVVENANAENAPSKSIEVDPNHSKGL
ncbi:MAG: hypothetical protein AAF483_31015, partial [Planctomycetota bacterium]